MLNPTPHTRNSNPYAAGGQKAKLPKAISPKSPLSRGKKIAIWATCASVLLLSFFGYKYLSIRNKVLVAQKGTASSVLAASDGFNQKNFTHVGDGRFNIVIVGKGGDNHPGGNLTDSIQILSLDTLNNTSTITSIPRDLYVTIPGYGSNKINTAYSLGEQEEEGNGGYLLRQTLESVIGAQISNFISIDFVGLEEVIDTFNGIEVTVPNDLYDPLFPDDALVGYQPFSVSAGVQTMNGATALKYARSRETTSDFDRSARQQLIISGLKQKALSLGTITNPTKISSILGSLSEHIRTDLTQTELIDFINTYSKIDEANSHSYVLSTSPDLELLTSSSNTSAGYIAFPIAGYDDFSAIHRWFHKNSPDPLLKKENAQIEVSANSSAYTSAELVSLLQEYGYNAIESLNASAQIPNDVTLNGAVYSKDLGKYPITSNYLSAQFDGTPVKKGLPLKSGSNFEVIFKD